MWIYSKCFAGPGFKVATISLKMFRDRDIQNSVVIQKSDDSSFTILLPNLQPDAPDLT